jgi:hypothetical protein
VARVGAGATMEAAARIGPAGNIYQQALKNPLTLAGGALVLVLVLVLVLRRK